MEEITSMRSAERPAIGVITTPGGAAQEVANLLVQVGVTSLLNFAPRVITVPAHVYLRYVDLSIELQVLGFYRSRQDDRALGADGEDEEADRLPLIRSVGLSIPADLD
jgi:redox-sensing transcriptional repressor